MLWPSGTSLVLGGWFHILKLAHIFQQLPAALGSQTRLGQPCMFNDEINKTLPETNIAPENGWLEVGRLLSFWDGLFFLAMLVYQVVESWEISNTNHIKIMGSHWKSQDYVPTKNPLISHK